MEETDYHYGCCPYLQSKRGAKALFKYLTEVDRYDEVRAIKIVERTLNAKTLEAIAVDLAEKTPPGSGLLFGCPTCNKDFTVHRGKHIMENKVDLWVEATCPECGETWEYDFVLNQDVVFKDGKQVR